MAFAETANLAVKLTLGGNFNSQLAKARAGLKGLDKDSRSFRAGAQIGTGIKRGAVLAIGALGTLGGLLALSAKEGQEAANVQKIYAKAIQNSGKVSADYVKILDAQQKALENLGGVDDELIKSEQTRLIQMGLTGKQVAKATPVILDFAKATGIDLLTATKLFGKAATGNIGALSRYGVQVDKAKAKVDPFGASLDALNKRFGGTTQALSGSLDTRLAAFREALADIREEAGIKLLPVLTRIVDVAGKELVPAFGKFIDRILPDVIKGLDEFAGLLSNGGAARGIKAITDALGPMVDLVRIAAAPVKAIVSAFLTLPKEVQTVLIGAFAVNKLTGGLVTNVAGGLLETLGKGLLGGIRSNIVNVQGAVVNVGGAGGAGGVAGAVGGGSSKLVKGLAVASIVGDVLAVIATQQAVSAASSAQAKDVHGIQTVYLAQNPTTEALRSSLAGVERGIHDIESNPLLVLVQGDALDELRGMRRELISRLPHSFDPKETGPARKAAADPKTATREGTAPGFDQAAQAARDAGRQASVSAATAGHEVAAAIRNSRPVITTVVNVKVTASGISKTVTTQQRYGPATGSSGQDQARTVGLTG